MEIRICVNCGVEYSLTKNKPGKINECEKCGRESESGIERLGGNMIYLHKTGGYIEIKSLAQARDFARKTRRLGAGVTASITQSKAKAEKEEFS